MSVSSSGTPGAGRSVTMSSVSNWRISSARAGGGSVRERSGIYAAWPSLTARSTVTLGNAFRSDVRRANVRDRDRGDGVNSMPVLRCSPSHVWSRWAP